METPALTPGDAVLVYLNVAALFAIAYGLLEAHAPRAIMPTSGGFITTDAGARTAEEKKRQSSE